MGCVILVLLDSQSSSELLKEIARFSFQCCTFTVHLAVTNFSWTNHLCLFFAEVRLEDLVAPHTLEYT